MLRFLHAADLHLDSPFAALSPEEASRRRREGREDLFRLVEYVNGHQVDLVLLAGDIFDCPRPYRETAEALTAALGKMRARVFIAPGNHDFYGPGGPWEGLTLPENVTLFTESRLTAVDIPEWGLTVHGAAFTAPEQGESLLNGFTAPEDGRIHIALLHGEIDPAEGRYGPLRHEEIASSNLAFLALGHIHKRMEPETFGRTLCAWPGCLQGRGFDELGEKGVYAGGISGEGRVALTFVPFARRRYLCCEVDVQGRDTARLAASLPDALPKNTAQDLCRLRLTGETGPEGLDLPALTAALAGQFYALDIRDDTRPAEDVWARAGEDSLRGLFLRELGKRRAAAQSDEERDRIDRAVRFGLAALDRRDMG